MIEHNVVIDPTAYHIVGALFPYPAWAPLVRLDEAGTRLYAFVGYSLRGCDLPVAVEPVLNADTVSITIATGTDRRIRGACDDGGSTGYFLPIAIPGGLGERTIVQTGCAERPPCDGHPDTLAELPLVRSQLVGCVPAALTNNATSAIFALDVCDDLALAEDYNGFAQNP